MLYTTFEEHVVDMNTYRNYRNDVTKEFRLAKTIHCDKLSNKLKTYNQQ